MQYLGAAIVVTPKHFLNHLRLELRHRVRVSPHVRHIPGLPGFLASLLLVFAQPVFAEQLDVMLDLDNDQATGCTLGTPDGPFSGVEQVLRTGYDASQVLSINLLDCQDPTTNTLSAPVQVSPGGWPVGRGLGVSGGDVVETALPYSQLLSPAGTIRLGFSTLDRFLQPADALLTDSGADILLSLSGVVATAIPTLQEFGIALLALLMAAAAFLGYRRNPHAGTSLFTIVIMTAGIGLVWAAVISDGDPSDWGTTRPVAQDTLGESATGDMDSCFGQFSVSALSIRCDMRPFVNTAPSFTKGADQAVLEDAGAQTLAAWATAIDDGDGGTQVLTFVITDNTNPALFSAGPAVAVDGALTYTPAVDANGTATITLVLQDDGGSANGGSDTSTQQSFEITVAPVNDAPSFASGPDQAVMDDAGAQTVVGWASAISAGPANESGQSLAFNITGNTNTALFAVPPLVGADGTLTYTPGVNASGSAIITLVLQDSGGTASGGVDTSAPQTFVISVTDVNGAPSFIKGTDQVVLEDAGPQSVPGWATAIDDGDGGTQVLAFIITNNTDPGLFSVQPAVAADGTLTYTPAANANGTSTITLVLQDDGGTANGGVDTSPAQSFVINVTALNDPPQVTGVPGPFDVIGNVGISVPQAAGLLAGVTVNDVDGAGAQPFQVSDGPGPGDLSIATTAGGVITITDINTGSFDYDPPAGYAGSDSFTYVVCDSGVPAPSQCSSDVTVNLTVTNRVWFVDSSISGSGGSGTLNDPYRTLGEFEAANGAGAGRPAVDDCVYIEASTGYTGPLTLLNGQTLVGTGATASIEAVCGFILPLYSASLPATNGANPLITSPGNGINLAMGNTLRGVTVHDTVGAGVGGSAGGTLTVSEVSVTGSGIGIDVSNGSLAASFDEVSSTDNSGIRLANVTGNLAVTTGSIDAGSAAAVDIGGAPLVLNVTLANVSSAGGSAAGIRLHNTTGTFAANGGTIANKSGTDGSTSAGIGVFLNNVQGVALSNMQLNDFSNFAIRGNAVTGFSLVDSAIDGSNGDSAAEDEGSVRFDNLLGSALFNNNLISGGFENNLAVINDTGILDRMTVTGGTIGLNATATGNDGILVEAQSSATLNVTVSGVHFSGARGDMVQCNGTGASTLDCVLEDNTFENGHSNIVSGGGGVTVSGGGAGSNIIQTYDVSGTAPSGQTIIGAEGNSLTINYVGGTGNVTGNVMNNQIGVAGMPGSGSVQGAGILMGASQSVVHNTTVDSNSVWGVTGSLGAIELVANVDVPFNATVTNNSVDEMGGFALTALYTLFGGAGNETGTACLDIRDNTLDASDASSSGSAIFMDQISATGHYNLPGYQGSPNGEFGFGCAPGTASEDIALYETARGNALIDGAIVTFPGVDARSVCGVTGFGTACP